MILESHISADLTSGSAVNAGALDSNQKSSSNSARKE